MRAALALPMALACVACATSQTPASSYGLGRGTVSYDRLKEEGQKCVALGGVLKPRDEGGSPNMLSNYYCDIQKRK
ncbi:hypothetical protein P7B02_10670 [Caulobacter segnis]|uniref:hypothetical protein n=1 Tax=Caulobacter segnis TaxID=88688 RepID=UPI002410517E|nr:hypothetical protein [Caulobacter segnis]MDG2522001.1 hypothetical protein [Caulobacter segnis]